jgi:hypothetical protein
MATTPGRRPHSHLSLRCFNPQFFIASRVGDAALEAGSEQLRGRRRLDSQMRTVIEAMRVLCAAVATDGLPAVDRLALDRLNALGQGADWASQDGSGDASLTTAEVDDLIERLRRLRREDPDSADQIIRRLVEEVGMSSTPTL